MAAADALPTSRATRASRAHAAGGARNDRLLAELEETTKQVSVYAGTTRRAPRELCDRLGRLIARAAKDGADWHTIGDALGYYHNGLAQSSPGAAAAAVHPYINRLRRVADGHERSPGCCRAEAVRFCGGLLALIAKQRAAVRADRQRALRAVPWLVSRGRDCATWVTPEWPMGYSEAADIVACEAQRSYRGAANPLGSPEMLFLRHRRVLESGVRRFLDDGHWLPAWILLRSLCDNDLDRYPKPTEQPWRSALVRSLRRVLSACESEARGDRAATAEVAWICAAFAAYCIDHEVGSPEVAR